MATNKLLIVSLLLIASIIQASSGAKEGASNQQQPLANLDKVLRQTNGVQIDAIVDNKIASNMTTMLSDMASNLRKMFMENRRLSMQVQDVLNRVQNATGVNATKALSSIQQQGTNATNLGNLNLGNVVSRMQNLSQ